MNSISDYKGLILITFIILAILYFSPDLECMLLFSGILVNIITICLNTGALKIATSANFDNKSSNEPKLETIEKTSNSKEVPRFDDLNDKNLEKSLPPLDSDFIKKENKDKSLEIKLDYQKFPKVQKYKGAIDYEDSSEPIQIAADRIPLVSTEHQGINSRRQMAGAYNRRKVLYPVVARELDEEEQKRWWGAFDDVTTIT